MNDPIHHDDDERDDIGQSVKAAALLGGAFTLVAFGLYGPRTACSVLVGAAIAIANLVTMRAIIRALVNVPMDPDDGDEAGQDGADHKKTGRRAGVAWGLFAGLKMLILFGGVWILLTRQLVDPMPLVVGYGVLPLGIAAGALWSSLRAR